MAMAESVEGIGSMAAKSGGAPLPAGGKRYREVELRIPSELGWERTAVDLAAAVARIMGFPSDRIDDIRTAVSEATLNAIEHGNALDKDQNVTVVLVPEDEKLEIKVRDRSTAPFARDKAGAPAPILAEKIAGLSSARGWGLFLIESLVDEVEYSYTGVGNLVRMVVHLEQRSTAAG
jgi:serine/threonine-protein kinase RsbW